MANIGTDILGLPPTVGGLSGDEWVPIVQGGTTKRTQTENISFAAVTTVFPAGILYVIDGTPVALSAGVHGTGIVVPFDCTITQVVVNGSAAAGSVEVDIWKCTEADYDAGATHPVVGDSITAGNYPTIVAGSKYTDTALTGWTADLSEGDVLWYNLNSVSGFQSLTISLKVSRVLP